VCHSATVALLLLVSSALPMWAVEWRRVGSASMDLGLAGPATGPVDRVWYSADGAEAFVRTRSGHTFRTLDFESWRPAPTVATPEARNDATNQLPELGARVLIVSSRLAFAAGRQLYRSEDGGYNWESLTTHQGRSLLGGAISDLASSPRNSQEVIVGGDTGVWRSMDAGTSWAGVNANLPNLPVKRILAVDETVQISIGEGNLEVAWRPGGSNKNWQPAMQPLLPAIEAAQNALNATAIAKAGRLRYLGTQDGRLLVSDGDAPWRAASPVAGAGRIERIVANGLFAIATTSSTEQGRVLRTVNGGVFWDDITSALPRGTPRGVAADVLTGALYVATERGVFIAYVDTAATSIPSGWTMLREGPATDVMLDRAGNRLFAAFDGTGVFVVPAPHRARDPRVVSAGDQTIKAVAPGALVSVLGAKVLRARAGQAEVPVLANTETESQLQLPFDMQGGSVILALEGQTGKIQVGIPLHAVSPSIFLDHEGRPVIQHADTGLVPDKDAPIRPNTRLQFLATGLGQVTPAWPAGQAAPLASPPKVVANIMALLDDEAIEVTSATLAPGYAGIYIIEVVIPALLNRGEASFHIEANGIRSNAVQLSLQP
jgi:uncharacterized protein (TIGR03437 family)